MLGGMNHADVEPVTSEETTKLKKLFPEWTWTPRPVVVFHKGINFAASLSGMPHSYDTSQTAWTATLTSIPQQQKPRRKRFAVLCEAAP
jgi:hypothetical protein